MPNKATDIEFQLLLDAIYRFSHYDFRGYSMASLKRRLTQAKEHFQCATFSQLQDKLLRNPSIITRMMQYLTVQVSEFFRDPEYFLALREKVIPHLQTYPSLKVWVAGGSTGEELYSLAILFREEGLEDKTLFYCTDINPEALKAAEAGVYQLDRLALFTQNYQAAGGRRAFSDYYTTGYGAAIFDQTLKSKVVFSDHSLVSDSVFAEVHLVSCRNVLIYFDKEFQDRAIGILKSSLIRKGFLGLGMKETLRFSSHAESFSDFSPHEKIYQKKGEQ